MLLVMTTITYNNNYYYYLLYQLYSHSNHSYNFSAFYNTSEYVKFGLNTVSLQ